MKTYILYLISAFAFAHSVCAQSDSTMQEKDLQSLEFVSNSYGFHSTLDSLNRERYASSSLGQMLQITNSAQVLQYGPQGSLITARINGGASDHTVVSWNNLVINSPSLGLTDLSLVPSFFFDQPVLGFGHSRNAGQGGLSAQLGLESPRKSQRKVKWISGINSMQNTFGALQYTDDLGSFFTDWRILKESNRNEFQYRDIFQLRSPLVLQENNNAIQDAVQGTLGWRSERRNLHARVYGWWQYRRLNIPGIMGVDNDVIANQVDSIFRWGGEFQFTALGHWKVSFNRSEEFQRYRSYFNAFLPATIDSRLRTVVDQFAVNYIWSKRKWEVFSDGRIQRAVARNSNFENGQVEEWIKVVNASVKYLCTQYIQTEAFIYFEHRSDLRTSPAFGLKILIEEKQAGDFAPGVLIQGGRKFRVPDFNERFWQPSGNPNLLPEHGWNVSTRFHWKLLESSAWRSSIKIEGLYQSIENWIQWVPLQQWTPVNYKTVRSATLNFSADMEYRFRTLKILTTARYQWNRTRGVNDANWNETRAFILPYTASGLGFAGLDLLWKRWEFGSNFRFTSVRYFQEFMGQGLTPLMPSFYTIDGHFGMRLDREGIHVLRLRCENVLNEQYQMIRAYAMPGRVWSIQYNFSIQLKK